MTPLVAANRKMWMMLGGLGCALALSALAFSNFPGSLVSFLLFDLVYLAVLLLIFPKPRSYAYTFLAIFLFLGFWTKFMAHMIFNYSFLEPTGNFDGAAMSWDHALNVGTWAAVGVMVARGLHFFVFRAIFQTGPFEGTCPEWYARYRQIIWTTSLLLLFGLNFWNLPAAFYQIGVNPIVILPLHLNVPIAWLINVGFAIWFAVLIHWEIASNLNHAHALLLAPIVEALLSASSALSRSIYLLHTLPYLLAMYDRAIAPLVGKAKVRFAILTMTGFLLTLFTVQALRSLSYFSDEGSPPSEKLATMSVYLPQMSKQVPWLFVDRWVGLEGVLAVSAHPSLGLDLFLKGVRESPKIGNLALYQKIAKSYYEPSARFTFLTLPGMVAILFFSGSFAVVILGMLLVTLFMLGTETLASRYIGNAFLCSIIGLSMANVVCQLNFPYLGMIFFLQLWVALAVIWAVHLPLWDILISKTGASPSDIVKE